VDEGPSQIEEHIHSTRRKLGGNLRELEHRVKDATNWRVQFERRPWAFVGAAFGGGLLLSAVLGGRRRPPPYDRDRWSAAAPVSPSTVARHESSATTEIWDRIKGGLIAAAGSHIGNIIGEVIPGFREHDRAAPVSSASSRSMHRAVGTNGGSGYRTHEPDAAAPSGSRQ
jgi:hypothetical protein